MGGGHVPYYSKGESSPGIPDNSCSRGSAIAIPGNRLLWGAFFLYVTLGVGMNPTGALRALRGSVCRFNAWPKNRGRGDTDGSGTYASVSFA